MAIVSVPSESSSRDARSIFCPGPYHLNLEAGLAGGGASRRAREDWRHGWRHHRRGRWRQGQGGVVGAAARCLASAGGSGNIEFVSAQPDAGDSAAQRQQIWRKAPKGPATPESQRRPVRRYVGDAEGTMEGAAQPEFMFSSGVILCLLLNRIFFHRSADGSRI